VGILGKDDNQFDQKSSVFIQKVAVGVWQFLGKTDEHPVLLLFSNDFMFLL
jgi:hypothetical protein